MAIVYLGIGSNIGDRERNCRKAIREISSLDKTSVLKVSSFYETEPVGGPPQDRYINCAVKIKTGHSPEKCLEVFKGIERMMGREKAPRNCPRVIDIDILMYDDLVLRGENITIPHERMHKREFVLKGMNEIVPRLVHPVLKKRVRELYSALLSSGEKKKMKIIRNVNEMKAYSRAVHKKGGTIGFVPTMGYLHEGHMSLVRAARKDCDRTVVSIFVNPTQFGPKEDLKKYPRDMDRDVKMLTKEKADVVFVPETDEIYPENFATYVEVSGPIVSGMCGASRPGHFKGVATVVTKLFNIVCPDISYFGQKDAQQAAVIKRMVRDLDLETRVKVMPIVRETDGLAMSSRNKYLSPEERARAVNIHRALNNAKDMIKRGERSAKKIKNNINSILKKNKIKTDYIELADRDSMSPLDVLEKGKTIIAVAAYVGKTRLIDNVIV